ncbi:hypothetical protein, partial [Acinetobacter baumannii]|uniref:hypothetical protein n=1 Tax=Acinetobacter baumannii TaxID=470 RepID=UPI001BC88F9B
NLFHPHALFCFLMTAFSATRLNSCNEIPPSLVLKKIFSLFADLIRLTNSSFSPKSCQSSSLRTFIGCASVVLSVSTKT